MIDISKYNAKIIDFEGIDNTFKTTTSKRLAELINENAEKEIAKQYSFPNKDSLSSTLSMSYLRGDYDKLEISPSVIIHLFYGDFLDTFANTIFNDIIYHGIKFVILDRYYPSTIIYNTKFGEYNRENIIELKRILTEDYKLPLADAVIKMDTTWQLTKSLLHNKKNKDRIESDMKKMKLVYNRFYKSDGFDLMGTYIINQKIYGTVENTKELDNNEGYTYQAVYRVLGKDILAGEIYYELNKHYVFKKVV